MEQNEKYINISSRKTLFSEIAELPIDVDLSLPDYYPEITKILASECTVNVQTKTVYDTKTEITGQYTVNLLYADSDNIINSYSESFPFTKSIEKGTDAENCSATVEYAVNYVHTKATSPRKAEIHGSVNFKITVTAVTSADIISDIDKDGVYIKKNDMTFFEPLCVSEKNAFVEGELNIQNGSVTRIISSDVKAEIGETKLIGEKLMVKGTVTVTLLYSHEKDKPIVLSNSVGFAQTLDCKSETDDIKIITDIDANSLELHPKTNMDGEVNSISYEAKVSIIATVFKETEAEAVTDVFSSAENIEVKKEKVTACKISEEVNDNFLLRKQVDFSGGLLSEIIFLKCEAYVDKVSVEDKEAVVLGTIYLKIIGINADSEPVYYERKADYEYRHETDGNFVFPFKPAVTVRAVTERLESNGLADFTIELNVKAFLLDCKEEEVIVSVEYGEKAETDDETAVILYFSKGEDVWSIAKKYSSSPFSICRLNGLNSINDMADGMILIPVEN